MSNFLSISYTKNHQNWLIFLRVIPKIKRWTFLRHSATLASMARVQFDKLQSVMNDIFNRPPQCLTSSYSLWTDTVPSNLN